MRKRTKRLEKAKETKESALPSIRREDSTRQGDQSEQWLTLQQTVGNRAVEQLIHGASQQPANESAAVSVVEKSVNLRDEGAGLIVLNAPQGGSGGGGGGGGGVAEKAPKAKQKKAGVDSFSVKWA